MRKFSFILFTLFCTIVLLSIYSCSSDDDTLKESPTFTIKLSDGNEVPSQLVTPSEESVLNLLVSSNANWKVVKTGDDTD